MNKNEGFQVNLIPKDFRYTKITLKVIVRKEIGRIRQRDICEEM